MTVVPAGLFGVDSDLSSLEPGKLADFTVVDGNPFENFDELVPTPWVMRDGTVHRQDDLLAATPRTRRPAGTADWLEDVGPFRRAGTPHRARSGGPSPHDPGVAGRRCRGGWSSRPIGGRQDLRRAQARLPGALSRACRG
ncbi:hypothetical protein ACFTXK_06130 [Streptomyces sp. NPDC056956]|uniref:hypothetical protein n=1 Tax=Streptomyces sp. NPDC056956 TaxID=3345980 RepID=UPI003637BDEE